MKTLDPTVAAARPAVDETAAALIALEHWGRTGRARELPSERDRVFLIVDEDGERAILKIANALESDSASFQNALLRHLADARLAFATPAPIPVVGGDLAGAVDAAEAVGRDVASIRIDGREHAARFLEYVPGMAFDEVTRTRVLEADLGRLVASVDAALAALAAPDRARDIVWDPRRAPSLIADNLDSISDPGRRRLIEDVLDHVSRSVEPRAGELPVSLIHNDGHGDNVRVDPGGPAEHARIVGLVDFGDALDTWTIAGLATACAYAGFGRRDPIATFANITRGYAAVRAPGEAETDALYALIRLRLALSVTISAVRRAHEPDNEYL